MDLGDIHKMIAADNPLIRDVEIHNNREKRRKEFGVPQGVTAITEHGLRIPCAINYAGTERQSDGAVLPVYKILAELDWRTTKLVRMEVKVWPNDVVMLLDFGGEPGDMPPLWVRDVEWAEVK